MVIPLEMTATIAGLVEGVMQAFREPSERGALCR